MELLLVIRWLLVFAALTAMGAPLASLAFPYLPRRGAAFALPAALLPFALVIFWIGQLTFGLHTVALGILSVLIGSVLAYRFGAVPDWRSVGLGYAVFTTGFLFLVLYRAFHAGITPAGGEQFLHFGLTKALRSASALPPEDFWFAGRPLRYYYGTQLQVTAFSMLTGTPLRYGFNLGIAVFYGILVAAAYGLSGSILAVHGRSYHLGGVLGTFFVAVAGSTTTIVRLAFGLLPVEVARRYGRAPFDAVRHMPYQEAVVVLSDPAQWGWFFTRYVVPGTLQEFPLYSFIKGDLHGHALSTGYVVVAAALAYSYYRTPADHRWRRAGIVFGGLGLVAGVFGFMNTWSLPTAAGVAWLAMAAAPAHPATLIPTQLAHELTLPEAERGARGPWWRLGAELWRLGLAGGLASLVAVIGVGLASPFLVFGHVPTNQGIGFFPPRTSLAPFLVIYGGILALFAVFVLFRGWPARRGTPRSVLLGIAAVGLASMIVLAGPLTFPVLAITGPILLGAWWLVRTRRAGFEAVAIVAGIGLILSLEVVYARVAPLELPRWNTSLKVAVQGWTLAGVAAGATAGLLLADVRDRIAAVRAGSGARQSPASPAATSPSARHVAVTTAAGILVVATVLASTPFAALVVAGEVVEPATAGHRATLDGFAVHERWRADELAAITWLEREADADTTIVETPGREPYRWTNPASTLTGTPTVIGWVHQENYRGKAAFQRRARQVDAVYAGEWSRAAAVLQTYSVEYIYVGPNEREHYGEDLRTFAGREAVSVAFENEAVTIYAVDQSALPERTVSTGDRAAVTLHRPGHDHQRRLRPP